MHSQSVDKRTNRWHGVVWIYVYGVVYNVFGYFLKCLQ